jgi:hypothetical protein
MGASSALLLCLIAVSGAAAATLATTAESNIAFLPPPDKVDLLKAVTDPQLEGEAVLQACQLLGYGYNVSAVCMPLTVAWNTSYTFDARDSMS